MVLVYGVGVNDSGYKTQKFAKDTTGKRRLIWICPYYKKWKYMLERGFCSKLKSRQPTYKDVSVCIEWLTFSEFRNWCLRYEAESKINIDYYQLDKDIILEGNRLYSPQTCCFVTSSLNKFITDNNKARGDCLLGVHLSRGKYAATCSDPFQTHVYGRNSKKKFLGRFVKESDAHLAYCACKLDFAKMIVEKGLVDYDKRIGVSLVSRCQSMYEKAMLIKGVYDY